MVRNALMMNEFMARLLSKLSETEATLWAEKANQTINEASDWLNKMREEYGSRNSPKQEAKHGFKRQKECKETQAGQG
jgi:hypothetical protein